MPDHDHCHSGASDHGHQHNPDIALTALTVLGLAVALVDRFWWPLPPVAVQGGLVLAFLAGGVPAGFQALKELFGRGRLDIDMLMVIAALAAAWVGAALEGAVLLALFSASGTLEHRAMGRARRAVEALMALRPDHAVRLLSDGSTEEVAVAALVVGDKLVLRPGARMIRLVTEAQATRAPSERFSEWFGARYTVLVLVGSVAVFGALLALGWTLDAALYRAARWRCRRQRSRC